MIDSEMKRDVTRRVHKEYKEFIAKVLKNGKWYAIDNAIKISFYKEIHIYVLNGIVCDSYYADMNEMNDIIGTLWRRFNENTMPRDDDFLNQLMDFHIHNEERMKENAQDQ